MGNRKKNIAVMIMAALIIILPAGLGRAEIIYVDAAATGGSPDGSPENPYNKIQEAINAAAQNGDTIRLLPGLYTGNGNRNLDTLGKSVIISGIDPNQTEPGREVIIDCQASESEQHHGFHIHSGEDADCIIEALTIRNAHNGGYGSAINCEGASPTIRNCVIINNYSRYGGGIAYWQSDSASLINCTLTANTAIFDGGAIFCANFSEVTIKNCIFRDNYLEEPEGSGTNISVEHHSTVNISYCNIEDGQAGISVIESTLNWLAGNIDTDPNFASYNPNETVETWDLHLKSRFGRWDPNTFLWVVDEVTSPCIDAADPDDDYSSEIWPNRKRRNMGAYGGTNQASMNGNRADFDMNDLVDDTDLMELVSLWLYEGRFTADLDRSGTVDLHDMAIFAENWLWQQQN